VFLGLITQRPAEIDPTIISQCSTLFVMRLANDRDQALVRSAVSDAAANLLTFIPSLGTREVFTFGSGLAMPTRMRFQELDAAVRPNSEASGSTRSEAGNNVSRDLISSVIERWRSSSMSSRVGDDDVLDYASPLETPALQPTQAPPQPPAQASPPTTPASLSPYHQPAPQPAHAAPAGPAGPVTAPPSPRGEALRASILKKPLDASLGNPPARPTVRAPGHTPGHASGHASAHSPAHAPTNPPGHPPRFNR
jgi:hypothetical protein